MKNLGEHIEQFERLMNRKGFDGHFLCNTSFPGKLKESLHQHLLEVLQGETYVRPFYLTTYSHWKDEERPHVKCDFKMKYDSGTGFRIEKMDVTRANHYGTIKSVEVRPIKNEDIPTRENVNALVGQKKKSLKL
ncbi:MAG TPA: hypothetical protein PLM56_05650 [Cyclobacteriaceae bacterium]|nr:hypothetical protein [Cyclobacteriaceae bacterium]HRF32959.1 hypothetical protein [Cyclobacteriaceae bacterium]